jgi:hypothetical protein
MPRLIAWEAAEAAQRIAAAAGGLGEEQPCSEEQRSSKEQGQRKDPGKHRTEDPATHHSWQELAVLQRAAAEVCTRIRYTALQTLPQASHNCHTRAQPI